MSDNKPFLSSVNFCVYISNNYQTWYTLLPPELFWFFNPTGYIVNENQA